MEETGPQTPAGAAATLAETGFPARPPTQA